MRKLGIVGFAFFFVKGLLWLTVPAAIVAFRGCGDGEGAAGLDQTAIVESTSDEHQRPASD